MEILFQTGGMMQFDIITLYNQRINTIRPVRYNKKKLNFKYNYFENAIWGITGYALEAPTSLFKMCRLEERMNSVMGDIRDLAHLQQVFEETQPEIVIHMAAQPIVRESYKNPVYTYDVNVMGTVNVLECVRNTPSVKSFLNVTTDKVYLNKEWEWGYRENEELKGYDPYSNSKSCSELVTYSYRQSFFNDDKVAISTARAGNVIGGGDFASDRIIPDCIRAVMEKKDIIVRTERCFGLIWKGCR